VVELVLVVAVELVLRAVMLQELQLVVLEVQDLQYLLLV
jgi:hypothetical protein